MDQLRKQLQSSSSSETSHSEENKSASCVVKTTLHKPNFSEVNLDCYLILLLYIFSIFIWQFLISAPTNCIKVKCLFSCVHKS